MKILRFSKRKKNFTLKRNFEKKCVEFSNLFKEVGSNNFPNENHKLLVK